jgi:hypothetical protein
MNGSTNVEVSVGNYTEDGFIDAFSGIASYDISIDTNTYTNLSDLETYINTLSAGTYNVTYVVTDNAGNSETYTRNITLT